LGNIQQPYSATGLESYHDVLALLHQATKIPAVVLLLYNRLARSADWQFLANLDLVESKFQGKYAAQLVCLKKISKLAGEFQSLPHLLNILASIPCV